MADRANGRHAASTLHRRQVLRLATCAAAWVLPPAVAWSQTRRPARIGLLGASTATGFASQWDAFRSALRELGYVDGRDVAYEERYADDRTDRLPQLAAELVAARVDVLVTHGIPGTRAAKLATTTIPIVMATVADPVAAGLVASYARPGVNVTGISFLAHEMAAKRIGLLKEVLPGLETVAVVGNPRNPAFMQAMLAAMVEAARAQNLRLTLFEPAEAPAYAAAFEAMARQRLQAVAITEEATLISNASVLAALAAQHRLPSVGNAEFAQAGGLIGYGANRHEMFRRAAAVVDRLLRGAQAAELPVEQPTRFELVLNQRAAHAVGVTLPRAVMLRADRVIE